MHIKNKIYNTIKKKEYKLIFIIIFISLSFFAKSFLIIVDNIPYTEEIDIKKFHSLINKPINPNHPLILKEKKYLFDLLSNYSGHKINKIDTIFYCLRNRFGNQIIIISKLIFFCEILGCKRIVLDRKYNWFIKHKIYYEQFNITIDTGFKYNFEKKNVIFDRTLNWFYYYSFIKPELKIDVLKAEILNNIPIITTYPNDLFIHIRSGDIFIKQKNYNVFYSQPPLCFYQTIISTYNYRKIYIISENSMNPIINELIQLYSSIIYHQNDLKLDMAYLIYSYNIVGSISTFINIMIRLNDNIRFFFEYNLPSVQSKILHCHHSYIKPFKNITYFIMEPSDDYKKVMNRWNCSKAQLELMINEKCNKKFIISKK